MEKKHWIIIGLSAVGITALIILLSKRNKKNMEVKSYQQAQDSGLIGDVLYKVISREGKSKNYTDLIALDGGTVGIAHYAVGGLAELYSHMDTQKYFGKSQQEMINNYSKSCRPSGKSGNDTGWGCYSKSWWRDGFKKFLASSDSKAIQDKAWSLKMKGAIEKVLSKGWNTPRQIAIALGISNSRGTSGFITMATNNNWDAEKTIQAYVKDDHTQRRKDAIDKFYPKNS